MTDKTPLEELAEYALNAGLTVDCDYTSNFIDVSASAKVFTLFQTSKNEFAIMLNLDHECDFYSEISSSMEIFRYHADIDQCKAFIEGLAALYGGGDD